MSYLTLKIACRILVQYEVKFLVKSTKLSDFHLTNQNIMLNIYNCRAEFSSQIGTLCHIQKNILSYIFMVKEMDSFLLKLEYFILLMGSLIITQLIT